MPRVKIDYIVSFSSESPEAPASNLLANEAGRGRWLCARGEPSCSVLLQLPRAVQISSITIGAHLAALVEVLVGRSETPNDPFQVLVASSVFLSPVESRRATEGDSASDRVRSFSTDQLSSDVRSKRWDRIRVVCSQPYNKHCKYGLSFIHIFSPEGEDKDTKTKPAETMSKDTITKPTVKFPLDVSPQDSDDEDLRPGALFAQHRASQKQSQDSMSSTDSQIRKATSQAIKNVFNSSTKIVRTPISKPKMAAGHSDEAKSDRTRDSLMYDDEDAGPNQKIDRVVARHKEEQAKIAEQAKKDKEKQNKEKEKTEIDKHKKDPTKDDSHNQTTKHKEKTRHDSSKDKIDDRNKPSHSSHKERDKRGRSESPHSSKRDRSLSNKQGKDKDGGDSKKQKISKEDSSKTLFAGPVSDKPHELLRGVVFALSGYENPRRARVRDSALAMGAVFQRDWGPQCTHLICAFPNTPKLKAVRSSANGDKAVVVTAEWVERQAARRRRLPWRWFATETQRRVKRARGASGEDPPNTSDKSNSDTEDLQDASSDATDARVDRPIKEEDRKRKNKEKTPDSEYDTDDEIERAMRKNAQKRDRRDSDEESPPKKQKTEANLSNLSQGSDVAFVRDERVEAQITLSDDDVTDQEDTIDDEEDLSTMEYQLPSFFEGLTFAVHAGTRPVLDEKLVRRYVRAYGGEIVEAMDDEDPLEVDYVIHLSGSKEGKSAPRGARGVRGDWVWACHQRGRLCDVGEYAL